MGSDFEGMHPLRLKKATNDIFKDKHWTEESVHRAWQGKCSRCIAVTGQLAVACCSSAEYLLLPEHASRLVTTSTRPPLCAPIHLSKARCTSSRQPTACAMTTARSTIRKGGLGAPKSMLSAHILQSLVLTHHSYLKREKQPVQAAGRRLRPDDVERHQFACVESRHDAHP